MRVIDDYTWSYDVKIQPYSEFSALRKVVNAYVKLATNKK